MVGMLFIGYKVYKIVKFNDKVILLMVTLLNLDLMAKCLFYVLNGYQMYSMTPEEQQKGPNAAMIVAMFLPVLLLSLAVSINLRNWMYYFVKIGEMAYIHQCQLHEGDEKEELNPYLLKVHKQGKTWGRLVNLVTMIFMSTIFFFYCSLMVYLVNAGDHINDAIIIAEKYTGILYFIHSFGFAFWGALILLRLKKFFKEFYYNNWGVLLFATLGLSISLSLRGTLDIVRLNDEVRKFMEKHENVMNAVIYIFCDIVPICF